MEKQGQNYKFEVNETQSKIRLDAFITQKLNDLQVNVSRSVISSQISNAKVNGKEKKASYKLVYGDIIDFILIQEGEKVINYDPHIKFEILFEDRDIIVVNKPAGLVVHPAPGNYEKTLIHGLINKIKNPHRFPDSLRPGIVHRLDKDTAGVMVVCKNIETYNVMSAMFKNRDIKKTYYAIVRSDKLPLEGIIDSSIGRHKVNRKKFAVIKDGKQALTRYKVISRNNGHCVVEVDLETGRTHQIRVHFSSINAPVVGDKIYNRKNSIYKTKGLALFSQKIEFHHPNGCLMHCYKAPLPLHFKKLMEEIHLFF